jgi:hypothetical protein
MVEVDGDSPWTRLAFQDSAQIRRFGAGEPAVTRALIVLLRDVGTSSATEDRRHACVRDIRLVPDDARRATALRLLGFNPSEVP